MPPYTEDSTTLDEEYELQRIDAMTEQQQYLLWLHHVDQFESVPSYFERNTDEDE